MNEIDKKILDEEDREQDDRSGLVAYVMPLALKTLIAFLVLFSLFFTLLGCFSPKTFMNMYHSFGNDGMATYYAAAAVERTGDKHKEDCDGTCGFSSLLTTAMSCAANTKGDKYADKQFMFAERYLALPCHEKHSNIVDSKYLQGNELTKTGVTVLSTIYGYDDYVHGVRIKAQCSVNYDDATDMIKNNINEATTNTELLDELIAYTDFGNGYVALTDSALYNKVCNYYDVLRGAMSIAVEMPEVKTDKKTAAEVASILSRLSDLAYNLNKAEQALKITERHFTDEVAETMHGAYKGFLNLFETTKE